MTSRGGGKRDNGRNKGDGWEEWGGYMKAKQQKLQEQYTKDGVLSNIFKGISIYVNGYTKPSSDELRNLIIQHGGMYQQYLFKTQVTHIIATSIASSKTKNLKHMKIVKPEWITDSVSSGRLLSYIPYQLYTLQTRIQPGVNGFNSNTTTISTTSMLKTPHNEECLVTELSPQITNKYRQFEADDNEDGVNLKHTDDDSILGRLYQQYSDDGLSVVAHPEKSESTTDSLIEHFNGTATSSLKSEQCDTVPDSMKSPLKYSDSIQETSPSRMARAGDANFLSEFYGNSRLHHLSTWGAEYKAYVSKLQSENTDHFPGRDILRKYHTECVERTGEITAVETVQGGKPNRVVMHIDMDCFFVSVGLLDRPDLRGKPVAVTHSKNKGRSGPTPGSDIDFEMKQWRSKHQSIKSTTLHEQNTDEHNEDHVPQDLKKFDKFHSFADIASCSYEARKAGVKNGMFMGKAKQLCPELNTIPYNFEKYQEVSKQLYDTVASYSHDIEAVSCDEMLVDCTDLLADTGASPLEFSTLLRQQIYSKTGCSASAGLASNILLAKLATRKAKPNGQFYLQDSDVVDFIKDVSVHDIPGVGWSMNRKLSNMSVKTCGDLQKVSSALLQKEFGPKTGQSLYRSCRGQDDRPIKMERERKSVSAEINYGIRFERENECVKFITELSEEVHNRLMKVKLKGKVITLKLKVRREDAPVETAKFMGHGICNNISKSVTVPLATDDPVCISKECMAMLHVMKINVQDLRGIGIQMQRLEAGISNNKSKGSQSILNFTVTKNNTEPSQHLNYINKISPDKERNNLVDKKMVQSTTSKSDTCQNSSKALLTEGKKCLPEIDMNAYKDFHVTEEDENLRNLSQPIVNNQRVTLMSGHTLVDELARRKTAKRFLPPLPTLPRFSSPEDGTISSNGNQNQVPDDYLPSPSQVDPKVLDELPVEIRQQIQQEMNAHKTQNRAESMVTLNSSQNAGCSHWSANMSALSTDIVTTRSCKNDSPIVALPSPSQIDLDCLNALPKELQDELHLAYQEQSSKETIKTHLTSPTKHSSPSKTSPLFKVPKGRPSKKRKLSPKKLLFASKKSKVERNVSGVSNDNVVSVEDDIPPTEPSNDNIPTYTTTDHDDDVSLCGAVTITQVRLLLQEWLHTCQVPQEDDIDVITTYISKLILDHNLEQVDLVLKFMYRNIVKLENNSWKQSLHNIVNNTQSLIQSVHGSRLNVDYMTHLVQY